MSACHGARPARLLRAVDCGRASQEPQPRDTPAFPVRMRASVVTVTTATLIAPPPGSRNLPELPSARPASCTWRQSLVVRSVWSPAVTAWVAAMEMFGRRSTGNICPGPRPHKAGRERIFHASAIEDSRHARRPLLVRRTHRPRRVFCYDSGNLTTVQVNSQRQDAGAGLFTIARLGEFTAGSGLTGRVVCRNPTEVVR